MTWEVYYAKNARKDLIRIDRNHAERIIKKILEYSKTKNPLSYAKPLKNIGFGWYKCLTK